MNRFDGIKVILIDIDNTLLDFNKGSKASMEECFAKFGLEFSDWMFPVFIEVNDGLWKRIEKGELTKDRLHEIRWGLVFDRLCIDFDGVRFEKEFLEALKHCARPVDGAFSLLNYFREKNYRVFAASNAPAIQQVARLTSVGMMDYFEDLFISENIGFPKPSREFFDACFARMPGVAKNEAVMIGDSLTADIKGGVEYGLATIWFNYGKEKIPADFSADAVVDSLCGIRDIL